MLFSFKILFYILIWNIGFLSAPSPRAFTQLLLFFTPLPGPIRTSQWFQRNFSAPSAVPHHLWLGSKSATWQRFRISLWKRYRLAHFHKDSWMDQRLLCVCKNYQHRNWRWWYFCMFFPVTMFLIIPISRLHWNLPVYSGTEVVW